MSTKFTISHLEKLKKEGTIQGYTVVVDKNNNGVKAVRNHRGSKIKGWIELNLWYWCKAHKVLLLKEQVFDEHRKWRFDFFICGYKCGVEYEGIVANKSRHTTLGGYTGDADKYNAATHQGIKVFRYTALNYKNILRDLEKMLK